MRRTLKLSPETLPAHLEGPLLPGYLISGDEPLLVGEAADAVRARARASGFEEREVHFIERAADWEAVRASAGNLSLFGTRRLLEVRLQSARPGTAGGAVLLALLERAEEDTRVLILCPRLEREAQSSAWVRAVEARGCWVPVWPVEAAKLPGWLRGRCRRLGLEVTAEAIELIAERTEGNLLAAHQELEKLRLLGSAGPIDADTVLTSVADSARFDVFRLTEAVLAGQTDRALRVLAGLRAEGTEPTLVLWALTRAMRDLSAALASGGAPQRSWQRQSASLEKALRRAPRLPWRTLARRAAGADRIIKGRLRGDPWDEMALLASELSGRPVLPAARSMLK